MPRSTCSTRQTFAASLPAYVRTVSIPSKPSPSSSAPSLLAHKPCSLKSRERSNESIALEPAGSVHREGEPKEPAEPQRLDTRSPLPFDEGDESGVRCV